MKKKHLTIVVIALLVVFVFVSGIVIYINKLQKQNEQREKNVFDQMYYTRVHDDFNWLAPRKDFKGLFVNMEQLEGTTRDNELSFTEGGFFNEYYKPEYLKKGTELQILVSTPNIVSIAYNTNLNETDEKIKYDNYKWYCYTYNVENKTLTYTTNDPENEHKDFLYTIFLKDWFEANPNEGFSMDNLGEFTVVEGENPTMETMP